MAREFSENAMVDWVIQLDMSFLNATSSATRGPLTWNRSDLLRALPFSGTKLSEYVHKMTEERKVARHGLWASTASKISVSTDVWTSSNYLSFFLESLFIFEVKTPKN